MRVKGRWTRGLRREVQSHTRPCLKSRVRKGGSEVRINVRTGLIHIIVVRKKGDISVDHLYQWALKMVERCMYLAGLIT